jgi:hypothetical protein
MSLHRELATSVSLKYKHSREHFFAHVRSTARRDRRGRWGEHGHSVQNHRHSAGYNQPMPSDVTGRNSGTRRMRENMRARSWITLLSLFTVLLPPIMAYWILYRQALFVPFEDDYAVVLAFANNYERLPTLQAKVLDIASEQVNEYKLVFAHSIVAAEIELNRHLNFAVLTTLGNLFLLPIGYFLWLTYQEDGIALSRRLLEFLPISFLFFALTYWPNLNWATTALQNIPVVFFSLAAIYFLLPGKMMELTRARLLLACLAAALAAFTSANGFLLVPVGLLILLPRRDYVRSVAWCGSFVLPLAAYLYHYSRPVHPADMGSYLGRPLFFLAFLGCGAIPSRWPAAALGLVIVGILWLAVRSRFDRVNPVAFYFTVWVVATALLVAWVRGAGGFAIGSRYSIYSILLLIFCYAFLAQYLPEHWAAFNRRRFYAACLVLSVSICFLADMHAYKKLGARRQMILAGIDLYRANPGTNSPMNDPNLEKGFETERVSERDTLTKAIQQHLYTLPPEQESR